MSLVQKEVVVPQSVETIVLSVVHLAQLVKGGGKLQDLVGDLLADIQAVPALVADVKSAPYQTAKSIVLGLVDVAEVVLGAPVVNV